LFHVHEAGKEKPADSPLSLEGDDLKLIRSAAGSLVNWASERQEHDAASNVEAANAARRGGQAAMTTQLGDNTNGIVATSPSGRVVLYGGAEAPIVDGTPREKLTSAQYDVVLALLTAGESGLTKDQLEGKETGRGGGRGVLYRLATKTGWSAVILLPGDTGKRYRIV
jgi:hypothetical protein